MCGFVIRKFFLNLKTRFLVQIIEFCPIFGKIPPNSPFWNLFPQIPPIIPPQNLGSVAALVFKIFF